MIRQHAFRAMGTDVRLLTVAGDVDGLDLAAACAGIEDCERRWSRFRPDSEVSRLNAAGGRLIAVEPDTFALVAAAVEAWHLTAGRFDPTVLPALVAAGYDRTFELVGAGDSPPPAGAQRWHLDPPGVPGCAGITLVPGAHLVGLPDGVALDLGGIAKGHTADAAALELIEAGADGAMADLGGDIRVAGRPPEGDAWLVAVDDPRRPGDDLAVLALAGGAVATSSRLRRRWHRGGHWRHHLIDPATAEPAGGDVDAAVVVAAEAAWAEVLAKAALIAGAEAGAELIGSFGVTGLLCLADGSVRLLDGVEAFLR
jgi:thiamine biosynthesis lipoprotein